MGTALPPASSKVGEYSDNPRPSQDSLSSVSTTSLVFERIEQRASEKALLKRNVDSDLDDEDPLKEDADSDLENARFLAPGSIVQRRGVDRRLCRIVTVAVAVIAAAWLGAFVLYVVNGAYKHSSAVDHNPLATVRGSGKTVTLDQVLRGSWYASSHGIKWIKSPDGEDGLLLLQGDAGKDYLVVEDVRASDGAASSARLSKSRTLIKNPILQYGEEDVVPQRVWPSSDLKRVLISSNEQSVWRYSFTATYWILDVETQALEPLDPLNATAAVQAATWNPQSNAIAFVKDHNLYLRKLDGGANKKVTQITLDGGDDIFYGIPDWVYEEEVVASHLDTHWSADGKFIAFRKYDDTGVPQYPVQFFIKHPDGPETRERMLYPVVEELSYPKAGTTNPTVTLRFYDVEANEVFDVPVEGEFPDGSRVITTILWAGNKAIIKEVNRAANLLRVVLVDPVARAGVLVKKFNATEIDGGWFDITKPRYIPADAAKGRPHDGYIDFDISGFGDHLAYYTPLDNPDPIMLTSGDWEVTGQAPMMNDEKPMAVDLENNLVYFMATKESSIQRHVYSVKLDGSDLKAVTNTSDPAYYSISFSDGTGYALLNYKGPNVPWYKVISTPSNPDPEGYERVVEDNRHLKEMARKYELPLKRYGTIEVDGLHLNYVERLPPHFDENKKHPVLFYQYSGPKSQEVTLKFEVDFQSAMASLGYVVVTVDGRGTGFIGRKARSIIRGHLGRWEAHDQIAAGKIWAAKKYVDPTRLAIWGWSFGGYNTLKTLEVDAGETFSYGMAVAPVTDWRFYDSVYTERYMGLPQDNPQGYDETAVHNVSALTRNVRFMVMHGVADDNVHMQNTLTLLDDLDLEGATNYDVHVFPDSNHSISFHRARAIVYSKLRDWLVNAFNGEWLKVVDPKPNEDFSRARKRTP